MSLGLVKSFTAFLREILIQLISHIPWNPIKLSSLWNIQFISHSKFYTHKRELGKYIKMCRKQKSYFSGIFQLPVSYASLGWYKCIWSENIMVSLQLQDDSVLHNLAPKGSIWTPAVACVTTECS